MQFSHINEEGYCRMVEISDKADTKRVATAKATIIMKESTLKMIKDGHIKKGDVLSVAQVGGIIGAKKTSLIIPMCHNILLTGVDLSFNFIDNGIEIFSEVISVGKTGVEMEALTAVTISALTVYDMCKSIDKEMTIKDICLLSKSGGKSGDFNKKAIGTVASVNISEKKGVIKKSIPEGFFKENFGLLGDAHAGDWHRQVSLLDTKSIEKMKDIGAADLCYGSFAENLTTKGIDLYKLPIGTKLKIGESLLEVTQIGKECHNGCAIKVKVGECIMPKEGIFAKVLKEGFIRPGDIIEIIYIDNNR